MSQQPTNPSWFYEADGGLKYPVRPGDVWKACPHTIACLDTTSPMLDKYWSMLPSSPKMLYSDPPWGAANLGAFYTKAGYPKDTGRKSYDAVLAGVLRTPARFKLSGWLEMGDKWVDQMTRAVIASGGRVIGTQPITYYRKFPHTIVAVTWGPDFVPANVAGMDDDHTPNATMRAHLDAGLLRPGDAVYDTCIGRGLIPVSADKLGLVCYGTELSPWRMSVTLRKLADRGHSPSKVGSLA